MRKPKRSHRPPPKTGKIERHYERQLRKVARHIGDIVSAFPVGDPASEPVLRRALHDYADVIRGWATMTAQSMVDAMERQNEQEMRAHSEEMAVWLREELRAAPVAGVMRDMLAEQVNLITSLPTDAAERVHDWTMKGIEDATRAKEVAAEIRRTGEVTAARATLIARTEVARTSSKLTEARARHVGSEGYIWRTSEDGDVRDSHKDMNGKYVPWSTPPTLSDGTVTHAGQIYNCRCYPEPVIPE